VLRCVQPGIEKRIGLSRRSGQFLESRFAALQVFIDVSAAREVVRDSAVHLQQRQRRISLNDALRRLALEELVDNRFERHTTPDEVVTAAAPFNEFRGHCFDYMLF